MEKPIILCYGIADYDADRLERLGRKFGAGIKKASLNEYSLPIAAFAAGIPAQNEYSGNGLKETVLVFANFPETMLDVFLSEIKNQKIAKGSLKAILTRYNASWTPLRLYGELKREREAISSKNKR